VRVAKTSIVISPRKIKIENDRRFALVAPDLSDEFVLRPKSSLFFFLGGDRHEIGQHDFARVGEKGCFENVRVVEVTSAHFGIFFSTNAPAAANLWVDNSAEDRSAIESRPAKPIERAAL
jgi:hypothetical protein